MKHTYLLMLAIGAAATLAIAFLLIRANEVTAPTNTDIDWTEAADDSDVGDDYLDETAQVTLTFEHTMPGEYSDLFVTVTGRPGAFVSLETFGPGIPSTAENTDVWIGEEGHAVVSWRITKYGEYEVKAKYENRDLSERILHDTVTVE